MLQNVYVYILPSFITTAIIYFSYKYYKSLKYNNYINKIINSKTFIYSIAWEDFKIDKKYLNINSHENILIITTGGCNVLNTLLLNPNKIVSCDLCSQQNALLDLKIAAIKKLDYNDFWKIFGI